ncbi:hypothetical protein VEE46_30350 [Escherichia coli]|nr:hypothetical protein VEE46_30350 [Escherichia coli]
MLNIISDYGWKDKVCCKAVMGIIFMTKNKQKPSLNNLLIKKDSYHYDGVLSQ